MIPLRTVVLIAGLVVLMCPAFADQMVFDFEQGQYRADDLIEGWLWTHQEEAPVASSASALLPHGGRRCLEITSDGGWALIAGPKVNCRREAAENGPFSCAGLGWVRTEGDEATALIKADLLAGDGRYLGSVSSPRISGTQPWTPLGFCLEAASEEFAEATVMRIAFVLEGKGKAWFDDAFFRYWEDESVLTDAANLAKNSTFDAGVGDTPEGWGLSANPLEGFLLQRTNWWREESAKAQRLPAAGPNPCLRMSGQGGFALAVSRVVPRAAGKAYEATSMVRLEGAEARGLVKIDFFEGEAYLGSAQSEPMSGFTDWTAMSVTSEADRFQEADAIAVVVVLEGKGTAWFDDVTLKQRQ